MVTALDWATIVAGQWPELLVIIFLKKAAKALCP
jgi:hypothetical protein